MSSATIADTGESSLEKVTGKYSFNKLTCLDRLYHCCNLSCISWKPPDNVSALEKLKCPGFIHQKENTQAETQVPSGNSLGLSEISGSSALNSVNPNFTPCSLVLERKAAGRAHWKHSVAYPSQWEILKSGWLTMSNTCYFCMSK